MVNNRSRLYDCIHDPNYPLYGTHFIVTASPLLSQFPFIIPYLYMVYKRAMSRMKFSEKNKGAGAGVVLCSMNLPNFLCVLSEVI